MFKTGVEKNIWFMDDTKASVDIAFSNTNEPPQIIIEGSAKEKSNGDVSLHIHAKLVISDEIAKSLLAYLKNMLGEPV